jgi:hypothetical protein
MGCSGENTGSWCRHSSRILAQGLPKERRRTLGEGRQSKGEWKMGDYREPSASIRVEPVLRAPDRRAEAGPGRGLGGGHRSRSRRPEKEDGSQAPGCGSRPGPEPAPAAEKTKKSPAPAFHAASKAVRRELWDAYALFVAAYRTAAEKLRAGIRDVAFPRGSFPSPLPFVGG